MDSLPPEVRASYVVIIDDILAKSDLNTVTSKRVRNGLQQAVDYDITPQKDAIKVLIAERFEKVLAEKPPAPVANGHDRDHDEPEHRPAPKRPPKRRSESDDDDTSEVANSPPPKKKTQHRKPTDVDDDAAFAARLQAEEDRRARATRGGGTTRKAAPAKRKSPKKKTASKVRAEDDSDLEESGAERKVNRTGGFHKPLQLSAPLSALCDGETELSRPQAVKRIWDYVKARDLQDPKDKRMIRCDDSLKAIFKSDKVHMFTMNKILSQNLFEKDA